MFIYFLLPRFLFFITQVYGSNETVFASDGTNNTFRVMFPDPIEVLPNVNYTAYTTLKVSVDV